MRQFLNIFSFDYRRTSYFRICPHVPFSSVTGLFNAQIGFCTLVSVPQILSSAQEQSRVPSISVRLGKWLSDPNFSFFPHIDYACISHMCLAFLWKWTLRFCVENHEIISKAHGQTHWFEMTLYWAPQRIQVVNTVYVSFYNLIVAMETQLRSPICQLWISCLFLRQDFSV